MFGMLLVSASVQAEPSKAVVYTLPQGGELLYIHAPGTEGVAVGLVVPAGWASPGVPSFARYAWESPLVAQGDLTLLQYRAPGLLRFSMDADVSRLDVAAAALDEGLVALADAALNREFPWESTVRLGGGDGLDVTQALGEVLTGLPAAPADEKVKSVDLTVVRSSLVRDPRRVLYVVGDLTPASALGLARRTLPAADPAPAYHVRAGLRWPDGDVVLTRTGIDGPLQVWAWPSLLADDARVASARLLWRILSQRVHRSIRTDRGWTYSIEASEPVGRPGVVSYLALSTPSNVAGDTRRLVEAAMTALATSPPTPAEVEAAKASLLGELASGHGPVTVAKEMATERVIGGAWREPNARVAELAAVTPAAIQALAGEWLVRGPRAYVRVEPGP